MSKLKFHEREEYTKANPVQTKKRADGFGLSTFLVKKGYVSDIRTAKRLSNLLMIIFVIAALLFIIIFNTTGSKNSVDEKYYYDPTVTD